MIKPINVITHNVSEALMNVAKDNSVSASKLFFKINSVTTFAKDSDSDFIEISNENLNKFKEEKSLRNSTITFEQKYNIEIKSRKTGDPFDYINSQIVFEENDTLAYFIIKRNSRLKYYDGLYDDFINYITEQKLRSNIMLYLFDVDYEKTIEEFVNVIKQIKIITFREDKKFLVAKGIDGVQAIVSKLIMTIEEQSEIGEEDSEGKVDYSNRGFLINCSKDEQLFEFIKPQQGKHGRTCTGKIIEVETINLNDTPTFTMNDTIEIQESFENIKYLSTRSGFLVKKDNKYDVSNNMDVNEISFKTTGTINSNLDAEISINVTKADPLEDAVEEGMHVKVRALSVKGNIGPDTKIETRDITINGQTNHTSFIKCVNANIGLHRGKIIGRNVTISTLEDGEIIADTAIIKNAIRGNIRAKVIEIGTLGSYVKMEASQYIQVDIIKGEENKFIIDTSIVSDFDSNKKDDEIYLAKLEEEFTFLSKSLINTTEKVKKNLKPCEKIKEAIIKSKNQGISIPDSLIKNFKLCRIMRARYKKLKEDFEYKKSQIEKLKEKLQESGLDIFDTKVVVNKPIKGYNSIIYKLSNPEREITLKTDEKMTKTTFKLRENYDGVLQIINMS